MREGFSSRGGGGPTDFTPQRLERRRD